MGKLMTYFLPLVIFWYGINALTKNSFIILTSAAFLFASIIVVFINLFKFIKSWGKLEELSWKFVLQISNLVLNIFILYLLFKVSIYVWAFVLLITVSILLHEVWHFIMAIKSWVKIREFSIWFWQPLFTIKCCWIDWKFQNILAWWYVAFIDDKILSDAAENNIDINNKRELEKYLKEKNIDKNSLYLYKNFLQKIGMLLWWVLMNFLILYLSIVAFFSLSLGNKIVNKNQLTETQKEYIMKEKKELNKNKDIFNYLNKKVWETIWLNTANYDFRKLSFVEKLKTAAEEAYNAIAITYYSLVYTLTHPWYFLKFQSAIWVWKYVKSMDDIGFMNWQILIAIIALINASLFVFNLLPIPALDWWQIVKEILAYIFSLWNREKYLNFVLSSYIWYVEFVWFRIILIFWIVIAIRDMFFL